MQTNPVTRLFRGFSRLLLVMVALFTTQILLVVVVIQVMRRNKRLRANVFKSLNSVTLSIAGRRFSPYALLRHTGRRSGRTYVTPLRAYPFGDGFVVGLTWGPDVDWCRNVMAAGNVTFRWHGQEYVLERPEIIPAELAPRVIKYEMTMAATKQCIWLHQAGNVSAKEEPDLANLLVK